MVQRAWWAAVSTFVQQQTLLNGRLLLEAAAGPADHAVAVESMSAETLAKSATGSESLPHVHTTSCSARLMERFWLLSDTFFVSASRCGVSAGLNRSSAQIKCLSVLTCLLVGDDKHGLREVLVCRLTSLCSEYATVRRREC